jgi:hypothetical protein
MKVATVETIHKEYAIGKVSLQRAVWIPLRENTEMCNGTNAFPFPKGAEFKAFVTTDFGWVVFKGGTKLIGGGDPGCRFFKQ